MDFNSARDKNTKDFERKILRRILEAVHVGNERRIRYNDDLKEIYGEPEVSTKMRLQSQHVRTRGNTEKDIQGENWRKEANRKTGIDAFRCKELEGSFTGPG